MNGVRGPKEGIEAHQRRKLAAAGRKKRTVGTEPKAQGADPRRIVESQHIVDVAIWLLSQNLLTDGAFNQDATPAVGPAVVNCAKERARMMRAALQRQRCGIDGERISAVEPFERILKRNGRVAFGRAEATHEMGLALPIDMDLQAHERERRMRWGRRRSSRLRASSSLPGAARFATRSCNLRINAAVAKVPRDTVESPR